MKFREDHFMAKWDAIVVGAGNGGLSAALTLANSGMKTLLIEKHNVPGGFATSFRRGRFEFEASLHELSSYGNVPGMGNVRQMFEELGIDDKIEWCIIPDAYRMITLSDTERIDAIMPFGISNYIERMEKYSPGSRKSMERLFALGKELHDSEDFLGNINSVNPSLVKSVLSDHLNFVRIAPYSVNEVLDTMDIPKRARDIFGAYWCYLGVDLNNMSFIHYMELVMRYISFGAICAKGRSHEISCAFQERFEELGGETRFNSFVDNIVTYNGRAVGVHIKGKKEIEYADVIVCNAAPHNIVGKLLDPKDVPEKLIRKTNSRVFSGRGTTMFLGLDKSPDELGINEHCYMIYDSADTVDQVSSMANIESNNAQATCCLNRAVPDCSPEGTTILYFTTLYTTDCWGKIREEDYLDTKRFVADKFIDNFELATGTKIRDSIEEIAVATPVTYARYTDAPQGVIYGYSGEKWDGIVSRSLMQSYEDIMPGLYYVGGYGAQLLGFGSSYTSGYDTAKRIIKSGEGSDER
ncbi:MAG: NAD(P)/FAD-dependent oxidoreductase [Clostridiales bacterium]|nr:NAD(P)/FAD-dependent oxidoreductase [Clostridiales bacterium]